jgi:hypothetical protein
LSNSVGPSAVSRERWSDALPESLILGSDHDCLNHLLPENCVSGNTVLKFPKTRLFGNNARKGKQKRVYEELSFR